MSSTRNDPPRGARATEIASAQVARIPYLNAAPYYVHWSELAGRTKDRWISTELPPRQVGMAMERGDVDAGLMAVADLIRLGSIFEPLVLDRDGQKISFGIANRNRVDSVLLFIRTDDVEPRDPATIRPTEQGLTLTSADRMHLDGAAIALTGESSTSVRLLRLLLEGRHQIRPGSYPRMDLATPPPAPIGAALVIGDQALQWRQAPPAGWRQAMDLASEWFAWQNLPFVFARWAVRRELSEEDKMSLAGFLGSALADGGKRLRDHVIHLPADLGTPQDLEAYLGNFIYELGPEEDRAEALFRTLLEEHGIACTSE